MQEELSRAIGRNLRSARVGLGLTQQDVAERADLSTEFYARMERGKTLPSVPTLVRLGAELGVSLDFLATAAQTPQAAARLRGGAPSRPADPRRREEALLLRRMKKARPRTLRLLRLLATALEANHRLARNG